MAIDSNDQQITSEMSQRFSNFSLNESECHDAYDSVPSDNYWPSESTYVPQHPFYPGEPAVKPSIYTSDPMHPDAAFDSAFTEDTTDIDFEGNSVYPEPITKTSLNGIGWQFAEVMYTHLPTTHSIGDDAVNSSLALQSTFSQAQGSFTTGHGNERTQQLPPTAYPAPELYPCPHGCSKPCRRPYDLKRHIKERHQCPHEDCVEKVFSTPTERKRHLEKEHEYDFLYKCGSCGVNGFTRREKLKKHIKDLHRITTESQWSTLQCREDPCYVGEFCGGTWFLSQSQLDEHLRSDHAKKNSDGFRATGSEAASPPNSKVSAAAHIHPPSHDSNSAGVVSKRVLEKATESDPKRYKSKYTDVASPGLRPNNALHKPGLQPNSLGNSSNAIRKQVKANDESSLSHSRSSIDPHLVFTTPLEVIHSIRVIELHALVRRHDFNDIVKELEDFHISPVFDTSKEAIKLRGTCSTVEMQNGEKLLKKVIEEVKLQNPPKCEKEVPIRKMLRKKFSQQVVPAVPVKISALDPVEDEEALFTWTNFILPQLPKAIEDLPIGPKYSAGLVRQEGSDGTPVPIIRFRSLHGQSDATRKTLRTRIENLCKQNGRPVIPVQFSQGITVPLVSVVADDDPPNDQKPFAHQRRFWQKVGMGASIGMKECCHISATSGGYILVNERKYMLSVDHFIQEASECETCEVSTKLDSPSPRDVYELKQDLENKLHELELKARHSAAQEEIPLGEVRQMLLTGQISEELELYDGFRKDLLKGAKDFELGDVACRCIQDSIRESTWFRPTATHTPKHRMDWSISEVREQREGKNVHRHPRVTELGMKDLRDEIVRPEGAGEPCQETGDPRGGDAVHYVGQTNGLRCGTVNPALHLVGDESGRTSQEWVVVVSDSDKERECFEGDSGAWIIRDDNKLIGLLWGWDNYLLLFTPVRDVFADIERVFSGARNIRLPPHSRNSRALLQRARRICRKYDPKPRPLASGHVNTQSEEELPSTQPATAKPHQLTPDDLGTSTQIEVSVATAKDGINSPPLSPVPSLVSSAASCYSPEPNSPQPHSQNEPPVIESEIQSSIRQASGKLEEFEQLELMQYPKFGKILKRSFSLEHLKEFGHEGLVKHFPTWPCNEEFGYSKTLVAVNCL